MCRFGRTERGGKRTREGAKSGVERLERMKRGSGIKARQERSSGIEILDAFARINPQTPQDLRSKQRERNEIDPDSSSI